MLLVHCIFGMGRLIEEGNSSSRTVGMQVLPWRASNGMRFERTVLCHYGFLRPKSSAKVVASSKKSPRQSLHKARRFNKVSVPENNPSPRPRDRCLVRHFTINARPRSRGSTAACLKSNSGVLAVLVR